MRATPIEKLATTAALLFALAAPPGLASDTEIFLPSDPEREIRTFSGGIGEVVLIKFTTWEEYRLLRSLSIDADGYALAPEVSVGTFDAVENVFTELFSLPQSENDLSFKPEEPLILEKNKEYHVRFAFPAQGAEFDWAVWVPAHSIHILPVGFYDALVSYDDGETWSTSEELGFEFSAGLGVREAPEIAVNTNQEESLEISFIGVLQESTDLTEWTDCDPQPSSPHVVMPDDTARFYRAVSRD